MKKQKNKIIAAAAVIVLLAISYLLGGNYPTARPESATIGEHLLTEGLQNGTDSAADDTPTDKPQDIEAEAEPQAQASDRFDERTATATNNLGEAERSVDEAVADTSVAASKAVTKAEEQLVCTLSVRCDTVLKNLDRLDKEKIELIPSDGVILTAQAVTFYENETVFDLLVRELRQNKIHIEFENTPIYDSAYIEGIANLYEFDCGELSGWMYKVNGNFPSCGCSQYHLKAGDTVEWVYTCDLGADVGADNSTRNGFNKNE